MRIVQILHRKAHWIFEKDVAELPKWPPDAEGNPVVLVDITERPEVQEGWDYDEATGEFREPERVELPEQEPTEPLPTDEELERAALLLNQQEILINQSNQDETLAAILLSQQEGGSIV